MRYVTFAVGGGRLGPSVGGFLSLGGVCLAKIAYACSASLTTRKHTQHTDMKHKTTNGWIEFGRTMKPTKANKKTTPYPSLVYNANVSVRERGRSGLVSFTATLPG